MALSRQQVMDIIVDAAEKHDLDPEMMITIAKLESNLNPSAQNPNSSAGGLFQFINNTWAGYGGGDKFDAHRNADAAGRYLRDVRRVLTRTLGRAPTPSEMYLGHQQGPSGAAKIFRNPNTNAVELLGGDRVRLNGGNSNMTAQQFANLWDRKYDEHNSALGAINRAAPIDLYPQAVPLPVMTGGVRDDSLVPPKPKVLTERDTGIAFAPTIRAASFSPEPVSKSSPEVPPLSVASMAPLYSANITPDLSRNNDGTTRLFREDVELADDPENPYAIYKLPDAPVSQSMSAPGQGATQADLEDIRFPPVNTRTKTYLAGDVALPPGVRPNVPEIPKEDMPSLLLDAELIDMANFNETDAFPGVGKLPPLAPPTFPEPIKPKSSPTAPYPDLQSGSPGQRGPVPEIDVPIDLLDPLGTKSRTAPGQQGTRAGPAPRLVRDSPLDFLPDVGPAGTAKKLAFAMANGYGPAGYVKTLARPVWDMFGGGTRVAGPRNNNIDNTIANWMNPGIQSSQQVRDQARATGNHSTLQRGDRKYDASTNSWNVK